MYRSTLLAGILALAGSAYGACPAGSGGFSLTGTLVDGSQSCVCPSGKYQNGDSCVTSGCAVLPTSSNTTFSTSGMNLTTGEMDGTTTDVTLNLVMPMLDGRNYTNFYILAPNSNTPGSYDSRPCDQVQFKKLVQTAGATDCKDHWTLTTLFNRLRGCGFTYQSNTGGYETYDGVIRVAFTDPVTVGVDAFAQDLTRTASIDFPFRVQFDSKFTFELNATNLTVTSDYKVDFAIVGQNITPVDDPTVDIQYTIQYPYAILSFQTILSNTNSLGFPAVTITPAVQCSTSEYSYSADALAATCKHQNRMTFDASRTLTGCQFTDDTFTLPFTVGCALNLADAECPFVTGSETTDLRTNADNKVIFTLSSENFCQANGQQSTINNAITLRDFKSVSNFGTDPTVGGTQQNAWRYGDTAFYQIIIDGLPLETFTISKLYTKWNTGSYTEDDAHDKHLQVITNTLGSMTWENQQVIGSILKTDLGLKTGPVAGLGGQDFRFALVMDTDLFGVTLTAENRGQQNLLRLKAVCDVSYDTTGTLVNARRRRQASVQSGTGTIESAEATITAPEEAAAQPSSAVRTGPVLALAVALLSAVLMA